MACGHYHTSKRLRLQSQASEMELRLWTYNSTIYRDIYNEVSGKGFQSAAINVQEQGQSIFTQNLQAQISQAYGGVVDATVRFYASDDVINTSQLNKQKRVPDYLLIGLIAGFVALMVAIVMAIVAFQCWYKPQKLKKKQIENIVQLQLTVTKDKVTQQKAIHKSNLKLEPQPTLNDINSLLSQGSTSRFTQNSEPRITVQTIDEKDKSENVNVSIKQVVSVKTDTV